MSDIRTFSAIVIVDPHISRNTPRTRVDNYEETVFEKLTEVITLANTQGCTHLIWVGDFFHEKYTHQIPHRLTNRLMDLMVSFNGQNLGIAGNHDLVGMTPDSLPNQPIYALSKLPNFSFLDMEGIILYNRLQITGCHHYYLIDRDKKGYYPKKKTDFLIHVTHGHLGPSAPFYDADFTLYSDVMDSEVDVYVNGHIHYLGEGNDIYRLGNKVFVNGGSLTRGSLTEDNIKRSIQVIKMDVKVNGGPPQVSFERIPIKCAKPASEIFDISKFEKIKDTKKQISTFADLVKERASDVEYSSVDDLKNSVQGMQVEDETKLTLLSYLDRAEASVAR